MPVLDRSSYCPPLPLRDGHFQTIYPHLFRRVKDVSYKRKRIETPDGDFLDLDYSRVGSDSVAVISHGLEGSANRSYVLGMVRVLNRNGWDALAWNLRGCGGEPNRKLRFYHSGDTGDLRTVVEHVRGMGRYGRLALVGFSLGGNITMKYLGEEGEGAGDFIHAAVAFSVPCDLASGARKMASRANRIYMKRFIRMLHRKILLKMDAFPGQIDDEGYESILTFEHFDGRYTAPIHGFRSAEDYWDRASSKPFLGSIRVPALLVNALDDPFLGPECYPREEAEGSSCFFLETPRWGGHVGFVSFSRSGEYWSETRTIEFLNSTHQGCNRPLANS